MLLRHQLVFRVIFWVDKILGKSSLLRVVPILMRFSWGTGEKSGKKFDSQSSNQVANNAES